MLSSLVDRLNDRRRADEEVGEDAGFTLIELMVVLLIMAILLAIAIPTFLGVTGSANDRAAQSNLNTALTSAKGVYESNQQSYPATATVISDIQSDEPSLSVVSDPGSTASIAAGECGVQVGLGRPVVGRAGHPEEGRDGDGQQDRHDQQDDHELDEGEPGVFADLLIRSAPVVQALDEG